MTDDLVKRWDASVATARDAMEQAFDAADEMADRIEALELGRETLVQAHDAMVEILRQSGRKRIAAEARLAECEARLSKAVEALRWIADRPDYRLPKSQDIARAVLAEIEGGKDV